jgi:DNA-binding MarR family transcriptional regulator
MADAEPSDERLAAFDKVFELASVVSESMRRDLSERGLTTSKAEVLHVLGLRGPLLQRELSQALRRTPRHVTSLIDSLEEQGWVARGPHPTDRRAVLVRLTDRGAATAAEMAERRRRAALAWLGDTTPAELRAFVAVADRIIPQVGSGGS